MYLLFSISIESQQNIINTLQNTNDRQDKQISAILKDVKDFQHVESGLLYCGSANGWTDGDVYVSGMWYPHSKQLTHKFFKPYPRPPVVFLSDATRDITNTDGGRYDHYGTGVLDVTTTGFTMACAGNTQSYSDDTYTYVYRLEVNWLSVPR